MGLAAPLDHWGLLMYVFHMPIVVKLNDLLKWTDYQFLCLMYGFLIFWIALYKIVEQCCKRNSNKENFDEEELPELEKMGDEMENAFGIGITGIH